MKKEIMKITTVLLSLVMIGTAGVSCESWLKEESFDFNQPDDIPDSDEGAMQWLVGTYSKLLNDMFNGNHFPLVWEYDCDYLTGPSWAFGNMGAGNFQNNGHINALWEKSYNLIHRCNYALEVVTGMENVSTEVRSTVNGELKFLKAWAYFQLVRGFGPVPLRKGSVSATGERNVPRSPVEDVYAYIIELLEESQKECLKNTDRNFTPGRISAGTAAALLAKVYATIGSGAMPAGTQVWVRGGVPWSGEGDAKAYTDPQKLYYSTVQPDGYDVFDSREYYTLAYEQAERVMNGEWGDYDLVPYDQIWLKDNRNNAEHMWSLQTISNDERYSESFSYHYCGIENTQGQIYDGLWYGARDHWYKMIESRDYRVLYGVRHRWQRTWDTGVGQYYPNTQEWNETVESKTPPFDDGLLYRSPQFDTYFLAYTTKYVDRTDRTVTRGDAFWPLQRYADVVLIYAEAYAEVNGTSDGKALGALNSVRDRSNATFRTLTGEGNIAAIEDFRSSVLEERAIEFVCEGDRRWDLVRWGIYVEVMNAIGGNDEIGLYKGRGDRHKLFPIPSSEMDTNKSITENNPGWN